MFGPIERSKKYPAFYKMPTGTGHYFGREAVGRIYGQPFLIVFLIELSMWWGFSHPTHPFGIGDIAREDGKPLHDHVSHNFGSAVDIYIIHKEGVKRNDRLNMVTYQSDKYDFNRTKHLARLIAHLGTRFPQIQFLYNDPKMKKQVKSVPPITTKIRHDEHIHLTFTGKHPYSKEEMQRILSFKGQE